MFDPPQQLLNPKKSREFILFSFHWWTNHIIDKLFLKMIWMKEAKKKQAEIQYKSESLYLIKMIGLLVRKRCFFRRCE